jgi:UDP-glucose 6-dehydrogenase
MRVTMIGAGYVGLVSGACFADFGHQVTVIDRDAGRVAALNRGEIPIFEPGLSARPMPTPCSSGWVRRRAAATVMPI